MHCYHPLISVFLVVEEPVLRWFSLAVLAITVVDVTAQSPLEFDVASLKRNIGAQSAFGSPDILPSGEIRMINVPLRFLVGQAYPGATVPVRIEHLPSWGDETYDLIAKGKPNASPDERARMFRSLMSQRAKLAAHFETRQQAGYKLVFARDDHRLGPSLTASTLDCSDPQPPAPSSALGRSAVERAARNRCGVFQTGQSMISGGTTIGRLVRSLSAWMKEPVSDFTGLNGLFALTLTFQHGASGAERDDPPSVFTALQEQLGLKLEPARVEVRVLIIDHIERPSDN